MSEFAYINRTYGLSIKRGSRVEYTGNPDPHKPIPRQGSVTSADGAHINIRFDGDKKPSGPFHPTWELRYLASGRDTP
jgi:hypothetical protein